MSTDQIIQSLRAEILREFVQSTSLDDFASMKFGKTSETSAPVAAAKTGGVVRTGRATADDLATDVEELVNAIKAYDKDGVTSEELRNKLQWDRQKFLYRVAAAVNGGLIRKKGERRAQRLIAK